MCIRVAVHLASLRHCVPFNQVIMTQVRYGSSSLFISNSVARKTSDFKVRLDLEKLVCDNVHETKKNLERRRFNNFDIDAFGTAYKEYKRMLDRRVELEKEKEMISVEIASINEKGEDRKQTLEDLKSRSHDIRAKLKEFLPKWWELEEHINLTGLWLPNDLDLKTPDRFEVIKENRIASDLPSHDHVFISQKDGLVKFSNVGRKAYYLFNDAAWLEQALAKYVSRRLDKLGYRAMICPDIFRSPIIEGCGINFGADDESLKMEGPGKSHPKIENSSYLAGVSLQSIASYLTKTRIRSEHLPMRLAAKGRSYLPCAPLVTDEDASPWTIDADTLSRHDADFNCLHPSLGLYEALQVTAFHTAVISENTQNNSDQRDIMIEQTWALFTDLKLPVRLCIVPAYMLRLSEKSRTEFQIYSPILKKYITAAYICDTGDFISRRLEILTENSQYCQLCHGCFFDVTKTIASYMENYYDTANKSFKLQEDLLDCLPK